MPLDGVICICLMDGLEHFDREMLYKSRSQTDPIREQRGEEREERTGERREESRGEEGRGEER